MVNVDGSVFIQIVNFLVLIWILNVILYKPIRNMLNQRREKMMGMEQDIETFKKDAAEKGESFSSGIKDARVKGMKEKDAILEAAAKEEKETIGRINERAAEELAKVRKQVAKEAEEVRASLMSEIDTYATDISQKILGRAV